MGRWKTARRGRSEKDDGAFGCAESSKEGGVSGWVGTAGGLWALRLNAPSRWFLASQAKITICKTKTHRSNLRSPEGAGAGLLALSVMATSLEQAPCQVLEIRENGRKPPIIRGVCGNAQAHFPWAQIDFATKRAGVAATFCPPVGRSVLYDIGAWGLQAALRPSRCILAGCGQGGGSGRMAAT